MSIGKWLNEMMVRSRWFNPHLKHGYSWGPMRSHFWLDLGWSYEDLHSFTTLKLRDPASSTMKEVFSYLYSLQQYKILRAATYERYNDASTVEEQLRQACRQVKEKIHEPQYINQNRKFEVDCK